MPELTFKLDENFDLAALLESLKVGARHSAADNRLIQEMHDYACQLGAACHEPAAEGEADKSLIWFGSAVKALGAGRVGGYLVRFGSPQQTDLTGDYFTAETDFGDLATTDVLYQHGLDKKIGKRVLGKGTLKKDDVGIWVEAQLELRDRYEQMIYGLAEAGKLGWSSATMPGRMERKRVGNADWITRWPLGLDASLTPIPAEPRTAALPLKSLFTEWAHLPDGKPALELDGSPTDAATDAEREFQDLMSSNRVLFERWKD